MSSEAVRSYLLGMLEETLAVSMEEKYFTDRRFFLFVQSVETGLIEDYLAGRLTPVLKSRFEARYLEVPELRRRLGEVRDAQARKAAAFGGLRRPRLVMAVALALLCVAGMGVWTSRRRAPIAALPAAPVHPLLATLSLSPGLLKGESTPLARFTPSSKSGDVLLLLELPGQTVPRLCSVQLSLLTSKGQWKTVWAASEPVWSEAPPQAPRLAVRVDAALLVRGDYLVEVAGVANPLRETYSLRVSAP